MLGIRWELVVFEYAEDNIKEGSKSGVHGGDGVLRIECIIVLLQPRLGNIQQMSLGNALGVNLCISKSICECMQCVKCNKG